jgi:hypothetical protein
MLTPSREFLFCESLLETTKAVDVLEMVTSFFAKQNFDWKEKLHTLCTDGAPATKTLPTTLKEVLSTAISHQLYQKVSESSHF